MNLPIEYYNINLLNDIKINYSEAKAYIANIKYIKSIDLDEDVEKDKLPFFVESFYDWVLKNNSVPNQKELWSIYYDNSFFKDSVFYNTDYGKDCLNGRLARAYLSFVREFLCILYINEIFTDYEIIYNTKLDIEGGIDALIIKNEKKIGVRLYTTTIKSLNEKKKKKFRHPKYDDVIYKNLSFNLDDRRNVSGDVYLYSEDFIKSFKLFIDNL